MKNYRSFGYLFLTLMLLSFLTGCGGGSKGQFLFGTDRYGSSDHLEYRDQTTGGLKGGAIDALDKAGTESVVVGWEHSSTSDFTHNNIYRGAVRFNIGLVSEPPAKTVTKATLSYKIQDGVNSSTSGGFIISCPMKLLVANADWHGYPEVFPAPDTIPGDPYPYGTYKIAELPSGLIGTVISLDVTDMVKGWVSGASVNNGLVFVSTSEVPGLFDDNNACWTMLGNFSLAVDYSKP